MCIHCKRRYHENNEELTPEESCPCRWAGESVWKLDFPRCNCTGCSCIFCSDPENFSVEKQERLQNKFYEKNSVEPDTLKQYMLKKYHGQGNIDLPELYLSFSFTVGGEIAIRFGWHDSAILTLPLDYLIDQLLNYDSIVQNNIMIGQFPVYLSELYRFVIYQNREEILSLQVNIKTFKRVVIKILNNAFEKKSEFTIVRNIRRRERPLDTTSIVLQYLGVL